MTRNILRLIILFAIVVIFFMTKSAYADKVKVIAHAGGEIIGMSYTNSREAFDHNYNKGFRYFEADFEWTSDGELVLIHDWDKAFKMLYGVDGAAVPSLKKYKELEMKGGLSAFDLDGIIVWLKNNRDAFVVTDMKSDNVKALRFIKERYPEMLLRFVPQIYAFKEYNEVRSLGYENMILTLYRLGATNNEVVSFVKGRKIYAVTMPSDRALFTGLPGELKKIGVVSYAHTVNGEGLKDMLVENGVHGVYTDVITPDGFGSLALNEGTCEINNEVESYKVGLFKTLKSGGEPRFSGRLRIKGCVPFNESVLSYHVLSAKGERISSGDISFPLRVDTEGVYVDYAIPFYGYLLWDFPSASILIKFDLLKKNGQWTSELSGGIAGSTSLEIDASYLSSFAVMAKLFLKELAMLAIFFVALLYFAGIHKKKINGGSLYYVGPFMFLLSMEFYWGVAVNGFPLRGMFVSTFVAVALSCVLYLLARRFKVFHVSIVGTLVILLLTFYYISFDLYNLFFNDFPSFAMLGHSGQLFSVLDSFSYLFGVNHVVSIMLCIIYVILTLRSSDSFEQHSE